MSVYMSKCVVLEGDVYIEVCHIGKCVCLCTCRSVLC